MVCPFCGAIVPEGFDVCPSCGRSVKELEFGKTRIIESQTEQKTAIYSVESMGKTVVMKKEKDPIVGWLVVVEGKPVWEDFRIPLRDCQLIIGSEEGVDIMLEGQGVEKRHASLRVKEGKVYLTDLDTETDTVVNGEAITKVELDDGSEIKVGDVKLKYRKL